MDITIVACGVFRQELDQVLEGPLHDECRDHNIHVIYLEMALHNDIKKLRASVLEAFHEHGRSGKVILLFGKICHPDLQALCAENSAILPGEKNCIDMFVSDPEKEILSGGSSVFYLTHGWFSNWKKTLVETGWDTYDARMNFGRYDSFLLLDSGLGEYADEALLDFFDYTTVPIEVEPVTLDRFTGVVRELIQAAAV